MTMNRPTIVRTMPEPPLEEAACTAVVPPRCSGVLSPPVANASAAGASVRAPVSTAPRVSVSDFIEGIDSRGEESFPISAAHAGALRAGADETDLPPARSPGGPSVQGLADRFEQALRLEGLDHEIAGASLDGLDDERLLLVASDRISTFDVVLPTAIPDKGKVLTGLSRFWFAETSGVVKNHLLATDPADLPDELPPGIEVDLSVLVDFHAAIHVRDLPVDRATVEVLTSPDELVFKLTPPQVRDEVSEAQVEAEVAAEAAEPATDSGEES